MPTPIRGQSITAPPKVDATLSNTSSNTVQNQAVANALAGAYDATTTYAVGDLCIHDGILYECTIPIATAEAWDATHWKTRNFGEKVSDLSRQISDVEENQIPELKNAINGIKNPWGTITEALDLTLTAEEYYNANDGTIGHYGGNSFKRTDLIDVTGWASATVSCTGWRQYAGVCFYDADQTFISSALSDDVEYYNEPITIPANAKYIGVSSYKTVPITLTAIKYISFADVKSTIDTLSNRIIDGLLDKNIVLFGDSVTDVNVNGKWVKEIQKIMKFKSLTDYARGYCQWCFNAGTVYDIASTGNTGDASNVIWNQYNRLVADVANEVIDIPDAIFIFAGVNDAIYNKTIGTVADAMAIADIRSAQVGTLTNVCASIRRVIEDIYATFPYTKIFICTPLQNGGDLYETRLHNIVPCIRELCANYAIDVADLNKNSGITYYVEKDSHVFLADGTHPTDAGGKHIANYIKSWMLAHYGYDETITKTYVPQT